MSKIQIEQLTEQQKQELQIPDQPKASAGWNVWECAPSTFDWLYDSVEKAYVYEGFVKVKTGEGVTEIKAGDFVTFPEGLSCQWEVIEKIRKVYKFE